jgi:hypothetical protein
MKTDNLKQYIEDLNQQYKTGSAREHAYRPALKVLMQSLLPKMVVTNEPAHVDWALLIIWYLAKKIIFLFSLLRLKILMTPTLTGAVRLVIKSSLTAISKLLTGLYLQIISIFIFMSMASCLVRLE